MTINQTIKPPLWFWIGSVLALLWNVMGVSAYLMDVYMKDEVMAAYTEAQKAIFETQPTWVTAAFAIGVFAGTIGCVGLLLRKKWAAPILLVSFLAVLARTSYYFFMTNATEVFEMLEGTVLPIAVLIIGGLLVILARVAKDRNWIH